MFINPYFLWGLFGISVPILIHLLNRFRHKEIDWAAMALLRKALVARSRQVRIEDILILVLRCLAVALIALALARPSLTGASGRWFGKQAQVGAVIAIDASYSMAHKPAVHSRFRRALQRVHDILQTVDAGMPTSLVLMGSRPRVLLHNAGYDKERFRRALAEAEPLPERLNLELCLDEIERLVRDIKAPARECYLVTDAQTTSWGELSEQARLSLSEIARNARLFCLTTPRTSVENLAITHFALSGGTLRRGSMARYAAELHNLGLKPQQKITLTLLLDQERVDQRVVESLDRDQSITVPLFATFEHTGDARLSVSIDHDPLPTDNTRHAVAHVHESVRVLCVDGDPDPASRPFKSETDYVIKALAPKPGGPPGTTVDAKAVSYLELPAQRLADYQAVILANLPDIRQSQVDALASYVERGGGLIVFLGDKVSPEVLNSRMKAGDTLLLPAEIVRPSDPPRDPEGWPVAVKTRAHPLTIALATVSQQCISEARVRQFFRTRPREGARTILGLAGTDAPLLVERPIGHGNVLLFTSTADRDWTNFIIHPIGPILLHQAITYLTRQAHERQFTVGGPLVIPLPGRDGSPRVVFRGPEGKETPVQPTERNGERVAELPAADRPGFHEIRYNDVAPPLTAAVNVDPGEADVKTLYRPGLLRALHGVPIEVLEPNDNVQAAIRKSRVGFELWRYLMVLALAVLVVEAVLAHVFTRRMATRALTMPEETPGELLAANEPANV